LALKFYCEIIAKQTEEILESLPRKLGKAGIDALVFDPMPFFGGETPRRLGRWG
jgi:CO dehydrogenase/acetyl-CoA synthase gamma subunit (corrinoid Fe-S protein)